MTQGRLFTVTWTMEIYADSPQEAAERALEIHRNPESIATVFQVSDNDGSTVVDVGE